MVVTARALAELRLVSVFARRSQADPDLLAVRLNVNEGRDNLWDKTMQAFQDDNNNHYQNYDWFVRRYLLKDFDTNIPTFFGRKFKQFAKQGTSVERRLRSRMLQ